MMKTTMMLCVFVWSTFAGFGQVEHTATDYEDPITEFFGIPFGASKSDVLARMGRRGYRPADDDNRSLIYRNVSFLGKEVSMIFKFVDDELFEGIALFHPRLEAQLIEFYEQIAKDVSLKYGKGASFEDYKYPYEKGDGHELTAIRIGKASLSTFWGNRDVRARAGKEPNAIMLEIDPGGYISLTYQDSERVSKAIRQRNEKKLDEL